jgi:hypothetical protein
VPNLSEVGKKVGKIFSPTMSLPLDYIPEAFFLPTRKLKYFGFLFRLPGKDSVQIHLNTSKLM